MLTGIHIRRATSADAALLAGMGARTFYETFVDSCRPEDMRAHLAATFGVAQQAAELADARSVFFIAEAGGAAAGYAKLHRGATPACIEGDTPVELARLYTEREWHGRGVGEKLMRELLEEARRSGCQTMWLGVWEHNGRALAFYRKWGFKVVGAHIFQVGDDAQNDLLMACKLN